MKGFIYIAGSFETVNRSDCGRGKGWIDNDPHFWKDPPTWGICRPDIRRKVNLGDYVFFVLPKHGRHPQMIFGYLKVKDKIDHLTAFNQVYLFHKRMGNNQNPNGNIIVDSSGKYNTADAGVHRHNFHKIKKEYVIGDDTDKLFLDAHEINRKAPLFISTIQNIIGKKGNRAVDIISRYGKTLSSSQVLALLKWMKT